MAHQSDSHNAIAAYDRFEQWYPHNENELLEAHRILMAGLDADALTALLGYTMKMGSMLPQHANKLAVEFQGHLNMEITM